MQKKPPHKTNIVMKSELYNTNSITTQKTLTNKFQISLSKLNDNSTKTIAFNELKNLIAMNSPSPSALRSYLSVLNSYNPKTNQLSASAKELQVLIYGYISSVYKSKLLDPLDKPSNIIKTITRILTQIRTHYLHENSFIIHKACGHSYCELLISSMPKEDTGLIINTFFLPLISLISSGDNNFVQQGAAIIIGDLIDCIGKGESDECYDVLNECANMIVSQILKGAIGENYYVIEDLEKLMNYVSFEYFESYLKEIYDRLIAMLKRCSNYQGKISILNVFGTIATNGKGIGLYQQEVIDAIKNMTTDRVHKVQVLAREVLKKWDDVKYRNNEEEKMKNNFDMNVKNFDKNNQIYLNDRDYKVKAIVRNEKDKLEKKDRYKNLFASEEMKSNYMQNLSDNNFSTKKDIYNDNEEGVDTSVTNKAETKNNMVSILKLTLSNLVTTYTNNIQERFNTRINSSLDLLEKRIKNLSDRLSLNQSQDTQSEYDVINNVRYKRINPMTNPRYETKKEFESHIEDQESSDSQWKKALAHLESNNINKAYSTILDYEDDIYLLRLLCLTGSPLSNTSLETSLKLIRRVNLINRSSKIETILINLIAQSIDINNSEIFLSLPMQDRNDIMDSLYHLSKQTYSPLGEKANELYTKILTHINRKN